MPQKLGQNFLKSKNISARIVTSANISKKDVVIEVGPGKGILTEELLKRAGRVIAVEKDAKLVEFLKKKFVGHPTSDKLEIIHGDILKFKPSDHGLKANNYSIVANIPYYITSRLLRMFLESDCQPSSMTLMVQHEVAKRIIEKPPHMNLLALSVQIYGAPKIEFKVSKKYFSPQPKVDSAVITISNISHDFFTKNSSTSQVDEFEKEFFILLKTGFAQKRKMLINNLKSPSTVESLRVSGGSTSEKTFWEGVFKKCKISLKARAENLSLQDWICIHKNR